MVDITAPLTPTYLSVYTKYIKIILCKDNTIIKLRKVTMIYSINIFLSRPYSNLSNCLTNVLLLKNEKKYFRFKIQSRIIGLIS